MIIRIIERVGNTNIQNRITRVIRVYDRNIPSGITVDTLTEAGSMIVASAASTPSETGAPSADGQVWVSNLALPLKGSWQAMGGGGGDIDMTNKSGSNLTAGTVVILDADNNDSFKTTTVYGDRRVLGVLSEDINNNATGAVAIAGKKTTVQVTGSPKRGMWLVASATAGKADPAGYTKPVGSIGMCTTDASGGLVTAIIIVDHYLGASASKGYSLGGSNSTPAAVTTAQMLTMASETVSVVAGAALGAARSSIVGLYTTDKGIALGGTSTTSFSGGQVTAYKITFATDTTSAVSSANLLAAKSGGGTVSAPLAGYHSGGLDTGAYTNTGYKVPWTTETLAAQASANLSASRAFIGGEVHSTTNGYFGGGENSSAAVVAIADRLVISTETTGALSSANLTAARECSAAVINSTQGYWCGGTTGSVVTTTDKMPFTSEITAAVGGAALSAARRSASGLNGLSGYIVGGSTVATVQTTTPGTPVATADKLNFSADTMASASSSNLVVSLSSMASMSV